MPFDRLSVEEQQVFLARLQMKKLTRDSIQGEEDLVVKANTEVVLSADRTSALKPVVRKASSLEELRSWLGHPASVLARREVQKLHSARVKRVEKAIVATRLDRVAPRAPKSLIQAIAGDPDRQAAFEAAAHAAVEGVLDISQFKALKKGLEELVCAVSIVNWAFVVVTIKAGGQLVFSPPGPHTLVAFKLIIEPGGRIVNNQCQLTLDCDHIVIQ
jgi:hypothetical protein